MKLLDILRDMDHNDESLWTKDDQPRLEYINGLCEDAPIDRKDVVEAAPNFLRGSPELPVDDDEAEKPVDEIAAAKANVKRLKLEEAEKRYEIEEMQKTLIDIQRALDAAMNELNRVDPPMTNQQAIRNYIDKSNSERLKKALRREQVLANMPKESIDPRMPIDQAFARNTKRGAGRPQR